MIDRIFAITPEGDLRILLDDDKGSRSRQGAACGLAEDRVDAGPA